MASLSFILLEDTREQKPLSFGRYKDVECSHRVKLHVGDYAVIYKAVKWGRSYYFPSSLYFDRKSKDDLFGTFGNEEQRQRYKREHELSLEMGVDLKVIVEADTTSVKSGHRFSKTPGMSLLKKLATMKHKYGIDTIYCTDRNDMKCKMFISWYAEAMEWYKTIK